MLLHTISDGAWSGMRAICLLHHLAHVLGFEALATQRHHLRPRPKIKA